MKQVKKHSPSFAALIIVLLVSLFVTQVAAAPISENVTYNFTKESIKTKIPISVSERGRSALTYGDFSYGKIIPITGAIGAGTNYQLDITVHSSTGTDSAGIVYLNNNSSQFPFDVYFFDNDQSTRLDAWLHPYDVGTQREFTVEIADSLGNSTDAFDVDIYIRYGSNSAVTDTELDLVLTNEKYWDVQCYDAVIEKDTANVTSTATATSTNELIDSTNPFTSGMVGYHIYNTDDDTLARITAYNSAGNVTLDTDIMANGEDYKLYQKWGTFNTDTPFVVESSGIYYAFTPALEDSSDVFRIYYSTSSSRNGPWAKQNGPLENGAVVTIGAGGAFDDGGVGRLAIFWDGSSWIMYYGAYDGSTWNGIGLATATSEGFPSTWTKSSSGIGGTAEVLDLGGEGDWDESAIYGCTGWYEGGTYFLAYTGLDSGGVQAIGIANGTAAATLSRSTDGVDGTAKILEKAGSGWDSGGIARPTHIALNGTDYLFYDGWDAGGLNDSHVGCAYASGDVREDTNWTKAADNPIVHTGHNSGMDKFSAGSLLEEDNQIYFWHRATRDAVNSDADACIVLSRGTYYPSVGGDVFPVYDRFKEDNEVLDSNWTQVAGSTAIALHSNLAEGTGGAIYNWDTATYQNYKAEAQIMYIGSEDAEWVGLSARRTNAAHGTLDSGYIGFCRRDGSIRLWCADEDAVIDSDSVAADWENTWHEIAVACHYDGSSTNTIIVYWDGAEEINYTADTHYTAAGYWGIQTAVGSNEAVFDDFRLRKWQPTEPTIGIAYTARRSSIPIGPIMIF